MSQHPSQLGSSPSSATKTALRLSRRRVDERTHRITLAGDLDYGSAPELRAAVSDVLGTPPLPSIVEVDLADVGFVDSTGLGTLVVGQRICADLGVRFHVTNAAPFVRQLFEVAGVHDRLLRRRS